MSERGTDLKSVRGDSGDQKLKIQTEQPGRTGSTSFLERLNQMSGKGWELW